MNRSDFSEKIAAALQNVAVRMESSKSQAAAHAAYSLIIRQMQRYIKNRTYVIDSVRVQDRRLQCLQRKFLEPLRFETRKEREGIDQEQCSSVVISLSLLPGESSGRVVFAILIRDM